MGRGGGGSGGGGGGGEGTHSEMSTLAYHSPMRVWSQKKKKSDQCSKEAQQEIIRSSFLKSREYLGS